MKKIKIIIRIVGTPCDSTIGVVTAALVKYDSLNKKIQFYDI